MVPLEEKKTHILRLVPLGVDFFTACVSARCTVEEMEALEEDEELQAEIEYAKSQEKTRLIEDYILTARSAAMSKQDYNGLRNVLKDFFPEVFADSQGKDDKPIRKIVVEGVYPK